MQQGKPRENERIDIREIQKMSWAAAELKTASLGDKRRNQRLIKIVEDLASKPSSSIPQACRNAAAVQAAYDFFSNPRIKASAIIAAHRESTIERVQEHPLVLAIQDQSIQNSKFKIQKLENYEASNLLLKILFGFNHNSGYNLD